MTTTTNCKCGHPASSHHTMLKVAGGYAYGECLWYGFNEDGGLRPTIWHKLFPPPIGGLGKFRMKLADWLHHSLNRKWYTVHCMQFEEGYYNLVDWYMDNFG